MLAINIVTNTSDHTSHTNQPHATNRNTQQTPGTEFLSKDEFTTYKEQEEEVEIPRYRFTGEAAEALKDTLLQCCSHVVQSTN